MTPDVILGHLNAVLKMDINQKSITVRIPRITLHSKGDLRSP